MFVSLLRMREPPKINIKLDAQDFTGVGIHIPVTALPGVDKLLSFVMVKGAEAVMGHPARYLPVDLAPVMQWIETQARARGPSQRRCHRRAAQSCECVLTFHGFHASCGDRARRVLRRAAQVLPQSIPVAGSLRVRVVEVIGLGGGPVPPEVVPGPAHGASALHRTTTELGTVRIPATPVTRRPRCANCTRKPG